MLCVWMPLNGDVKNQGLSEVTMTSGTPTFKNGGKTGAKGFNINTKSVFYCADLNGKKEFSVAFWTKVEPSSTITVNWGDIFVLCDRTSTGSAGSNLRWETCYASGYENYGLAISDNATYAITQGLNFQVYSGKNTWHHVIVTCSSSVIIVYLDGVEVRRTTDVKGGSMTGYFNLGDSGYSEGIVNDLRIWDHAITPLEAKHLSQGLVCHYKLSGIGRPNNIKQSAITQRSATLTQTSENEYTCLCPYVDSSWGVGLYINDTSINWKSGQTWLISMDVYTPQSINWQTDINNKPDVEDISQYTGNDYDVTAERRTATNGVVDAVKTLKAGWNKIWFSQKAPTTYGLYNYSTNFGIVTTGLGAGNSITVKIKNIKGEIIDSGEPLSPTPWIPHQLDDLYSNMGYTYSSNPNILTNTKTFTSVSGSGEAYGTWNGFTIRRLTARSGSSYRELAYYNSFVPVVSGGSYTQSFWARGTGKLRCHFYGGNIACASNVTNQGVTTASTDGNIEVQLDSNWRKYYVTHTLKTSTETPTNKHILLRCMDGTNEVYVCGWKLENGSQATMWCPNTADKEYANDVIEYDCSGFGNHLTKNGMLTYTPDTPRYDTATIFSGTEWLKGDSPQADIWTLSCWAKTSKNKSTAQFMVADRTSALCITFYSGTIISYFSANGNHSTGSKCTLGNAYKENDWNHFVVVKTGTGTRTVYCNGVEQVATSNDYWSDANGLFIGSRNNSANLPFYGGICDVRAYATPLSADDVVTLYNTGGSLDSSGTFYTYEYVEGE